MSEMDIGDRGHKCFRSWSGKWKCSSRNLLIREPTSISLGAPRLESAPKVAAFFCPCRPLDSLSRPSVWIGAKAGCQKDGIGFLDATFWNVRRGETQFVLVFCWNIDVSAPKGDSVAEMIWPTPPEKNFGLVVPFTAAIGNSKQAFIIWRPLKHEAPARLDQSAFLTGYH
jgi:hypothetical protein